MSIELDACKFCGAKAVPNYYRGDHWVTCPQCKVGTATFGSAERAAASWNRRAQPAEEVQPVAKHTCAARHHTLAEPQDCDWPVCGCDPHATKVIEALQESGALYNHPQAADAETVRKAARYDFLRDHPQKHNNGASAIHFTFAVARPAPNEWCIDTKRGEDMDAAIDAALAASKEKKE